MWLAFPIMPMTLKELHEALAIAPEARDLDQEALLSSPEDVLEFCSSLITVNEHGFVRLAHLSVKEYLLSDRALSRFRLDEVSTRRRVCTLCLTYLTFDHLRLGPATSQEAYSDRLRRYPLLLHLAVIWPYHFRIVGSNDAALSSFVFETFFNAQNRNIFMSWVQLLNANSIESNWDFYPENATPLYYAASFGMTDAVRKLIRDGADLNVGASRFGGTAVHAATLRLRVPAMIALLEAGADPNKADFNGLTPMATARAYGEPEVIDTLLKYGANSGPLEESETTNLEGHHHAIGHMQQTDHSLTRQRVRDLKGATEEVIFTTTRADPRDPREAGKAVQIPSDWRQFPSGSALWSAIS